ncbi:GT1-family glycosyltransferase [Actinokineospora auranticolor]|uniref:Glycosyltransferase GtfC/desvancosaminyl-vancomycin vancosaminetransferase/vancomycin aglycone glucosyltransferase n=1 Tax=Actinokineospora auranticolor TaxID=155976 RepID=A0A2S6GUE5_9PSEU|nr:glycosyltransferase [Actinokineospora auranticolor]PPK68816.1 glycosyltransferase GtfC/desvancosaminyl-vancomycin vancosaminetransferase/vancomycin aglycone glucosyltransferase [Actinokineospora auranticolor]
MRVLLSTSGSRGDVEPLVALAVRLRALDARVRVCAPPFAAERLAEVGVPHVPVGLPQRVVLRDGTPPPSPEEQRRLEAGAVAMQFERVPAAAEGCDVVVATGELAAAAAVRSVAEKRGIPYSYAAYSPVYLPSRHHVPPVDERTEPGVTDNGVLWAQRRLRFHSRFGEPLNANRAAIGLPPVDNAFDHAYADRPWLAADPVLAPLPPDLDAVQTGVWVLPDERPLPGPLVDFLDAGEPPVYLGFGSTTGTDDAAGAAIEAIRGHGRRVILSSGWADLARPDDGADCFVVSEVNLQVLFGLVAAVVHPGSAGTTHVATRAGVPQVLVPRSTDQPYHAGRAAELGIGVVHDSLTTTVESLSAALAAALAPETRDRAAAVAGTMRTDGTSVAARLLFDVVNREKPTVSA